MAIESPIAEALVPQMFLPDAKFKVALKSKVQRHHLILLLNTITIVTILLTTISVPSSYAQKLHTEDYIITDFGLRDSNTPFLTVEGTAGGSYDASLGDEGFQAYVFKSDKGNFIISVSEPAGIDTNPYYSADRLLTSDITLNGCLHTESGLGKPSFQNHTVEYLGRNLNLTAVHHVYSIQVTEDDPDENCESGNHIDKIYSHMNRRDTG